MESKVGKKILTLRKESGMSQEQLAEKLSVSRQAISKWERGESLPELYNLMAISDIFSISMDYLTKDGALIEKEEKTKLALESIEIKDENVNKKSLISLSVGIVIILISVFSYILIENYMGKGLTIFIFSILLSIGLFFILYSEKEKFVYKVKIYNEKTNENVNVNVNTVNNGLLVGTFGIILIVIATMSYVMLEMFFTEGIVILLFGAVTAIGIVFIIYGYSNSYSYLKKQGVDIEEKDTTKMGLLKEFLGEICSIVYLILGFGFELWHPGWIIFLIPAVVIAVYKFKKI